MCHLPWTAWQNVCSRPCGSTCISSEWTNITPLVPIEVESVPRVTTPVPTALAAQSPAPPTTTQSVERPSCLATAGSQLAGDFLRLVARWPAATRRARASRAASSTSCAWPRRAAACRWRRSLRWRIRPSAGGECRPWAAALSASLSKFFGSWFRSQRIFGAVKPVSAGLATSWISFLRPPARSSISSHSACGPLVVPEQGVADDLAALVEKHRAVHLPREADRLHVGRLELGLLHDRLDRRHGRLPPIFRDPARSTAAAGNSRDTSAAASARIAPCSLIASVLVPEVPISMPRNTPMIPTPRMQSPQVIAERGGILTLRAAAGNGVEASCRPDFRPHRLAGILTNMTTALQLPRSPELMNRDDAALLVVDMQAKLLPLIPGQNRLIWNIRRLIDGAKILGRAGRGDRAISAGPRTDDAELAERLGTIPAKTRVQLRRVRRDFYRRGATGASGKFWSAASRRTSASARRSTTCWARDFASMWRPTPSPRGARSTTRSPCGGWTRPARR